MSRPRGFAPYSPRAATQELIGQIQVVLDEYEHLLPLTLRQVFYRLVARFMFPKSEQDYSRLGEVLARARRGSIIPMDAIRDDGFRQHEPGGYSDKANFRHAVNQAIEEFRLDRQRCQDRRIVLWCEASGMAPQLTRASFEYGVPVFSSGGFDSVSAKHAVAKDFSEFDQGVEVLHIGDHDPSGIHLFGSLDEDVRAFLDHYGGDVEFTRIAVTPEQIERLNLPTAPPKPTDRRSFSGLTTQAEAIDPAELACIVRDAIESRIDLMAFNAAIAREHSIRDELRSEFGFTDGGSNHG